MTTSEAAGANDLRNEIRATLRRLERLAGEGRIVMTQDRYNTDFRDSATAVSTAVEALNQADAAMLWMETLPHPDGGYPPIAD